MYGVFGVCVRVKQPQESVHGKCDLWGGNCNLCGVNVIYPCVFMYRCASLCRHLWKTETDFKNGLLA